MAIPNEKLSILTIDELIDSKSRRYYEAKSSEIALIEKYADREKTFFISKILESRYACPWLKCKYNYVLCLFSNVLERECRGVAEGNNKSNTIFRAFAEAYERYMLLTGSVKKRSSNGFAAHVDIYSACLNACMEVIERDAILRSWFRKIPPVKILKPLFLDKHLRIAHKYGFDVRFYQIETEWLTENDKPLFIVLSIIKPAASRGYYRKLIYPNSFNGRLVGFGCSFSRSTAIWKSFREASLPAWYYYRDLPDFTPVEKIDERKNIDHFRFYLNPSHIEAFNFIESEELDIEVINDVGDKCVNDALAKLTCIRDNAKYNNYSISYSIYELDESNEMPFWVASADIPQLQDLWFGHTYDFINEERLGLKEELRYMQPWPHPIA